MHSIVLHVPYLRRALENCLYVRFVEVIPWAAVADESRVVARDKHTVLTSAQLRPPNNSPATKP